jgi:catechol 2,3-dioxygenase-like lactoylglutathione lyase family enzyme
MRLSYVMKFVADMDKAVAFYRDVLGLKLRFASPGWSEFETGETTLALHQASDTHPAGSCQIGFTVEDIDAFFQDKGAKGVVFTRPPTMEHGAKLADFVDSEGAEVSVSG